MSQSIIPISTENASYADWYNGKIRLDRCGKVRTLKIAWDGNISTSGVTLCTLDARDRPPAELTASIPGWLVSNRQRVVVGTNGPVRLISNAGSYSDFFFAQISWIVQ